MNGIAGPLNGTTIVQPAAAAAPVPVTKIEPSQLWQGNLFVPFDSDGSFRVTAEAHHPHDKAVDLYQQLVQFDELHATEIELDQLPGPVKQAALHGKQALTHAKMVDPIVDFQGYMAPVAADECSYLCGGWADHTCVRWKMTVKIGKRNQAFERMINFMLDRLLPGHLALEASQLAARGAALAADRRELNRRQGWMNEISGSKEGTLFVQVYQKAQKQQNNQQSNVQDMDIDGDDDDDQGAGNADDLVREEQLQAQESELQAAWDALGQKILNHKGTGVLALQLDHVPDSWPGGDKLYLLPFKEDRSAHALEQQPCLLCLGSTRECIQLSSPAWTNHKKATQPAIKKSGSGQAISRQVSFKEPLQLATHLSRGRKTNKDLDNMIKRRKLNNGGVGQGNTQHGQQLQPEIRTDMLMANVSELAMASLLTLAAPQLPDVYRSMLLPCFSAESIIHKARDIATMLIRPPPRPPVGRAAQENRQVGAAVNADDGRTGLAELTNLPVTQQPPNITPEETHVIVEIKPQQDGKNTKGLPSLSLKLDSQGGGVCVNIQANQSASDMDVSTGAHSLTSVGGPQSVNQNQLEQQQPPRQPCGSIQDLINRPQSQQQVRRLFSDIQQLCLKPVKDLRVLYLHTPAKPEVTPDRLQSLGLNVTYQRFTIDPPPNVTDYDVVVLSKSQEQKRAVPQETKFNIRAMRLHPCRFLSAEDIDAVATELAQQDPNFCFDPEQPLPVKPENDTLKPGLLLTLDSAAWLSASPAVLAQLLLMIRVARRIYNSEDCWTVLMRCTDIEQVLMFGSDAAVSVLMDGLEAGLLKEIPSGGMSRAAHVEVPQVVRDTLKTITIPLYAAMRFVVVGYHSSEEAHDRKLSCETHKVLLHGTIPEVIHFLEYLTSPQ